MKRSEVIEKIQKCSYEYISYEDSEIILNTLEKIGMLPPPCTVIVKEGRHTPTERKWDEE